MGGITESARERETFKYDPALVEGTTVNESSTPRPASDLVTSSDTTLTALCQLAAVRLDVQRVLLSLFDAKYQYIIAEATRTSPLTAKTKYTGDGHDGGLWLCGTAIPRAFGICEHVIETVPQERGRRDRASVEKDLPVTVIPNLLEHRAFVNKPYCRSPFYAGVPIRTPKGIIIGVLCVFDEKKHDDLDPGSKTIMRVLSANIMSHLEVRRTKIAYNRSQRMVRGIGAFFEGKDSMSGWEDSPSESVFGAASTTSVQAGQTRDLRNTEGAELITDSESLAPTAKPVSVIAKESDDDRAQSPNASTASRIVAAEVHVTNASDTSSVTEMASLDPASEQTQTSRIICKAATVLTESLEVSGVVFVDASVHSFGGYHTRNSSASDEDSRGQKQSRQADDEDSTCAVLGFSTTESSSDGSLSHLRVPERLLARLLKRYPEGHIFNFDEHGSNHATDLSDDSELNRTATRKVMSFPDVEAEITRSKARPFLRESEAMTIVGIFPGARSVALVPVWDARRQRWFAGGFAYTTSPTRIFSADNELSYLKAMGTVVMAEISRAEIVTADRAKSDALSSVSHELRSPLHGLLLGVELLSHTVLDAFQGNTLHTVETCGRTLLDTIDHLLDFSKINNFTTTTKRRKGGVRGFGPNGTGTIEAGMSSLSADVHLDLIAEEIVESLYFGHHYQRMSLAQMDKQMPTEYEDLHALRRLDSMPTVEGISTEGRMVLDAQTMCEKVAIYLDIDPKEAWVFHTQPGAVRRILMNLVGNSLKYTTEGSVQVCLRQDTPKGKNQDGYRNIRITVSDTGKGMGEDYLQNHLYRPFAQEDALAPGTGLGLSLVKQITTSLGGTIKIESRVGVGTIAQICIPMLSATSISTGLVDTAAEVDFTDRIAQLEGLRVRLYGFGENQGTDGSAAKVDDLKLMETTCRDWLHMRLITSANAQDFAPDILLCSEAGLGRLLQESQGVKLPPMVTICRNVLDAREMSSFFVDQKSERGVFEFVSQPTGPRKLAKVLLLCLNHWTEAQDTLDLSEVEVGLPTILSPQPDDNTYAAAPGAEIHGRDSGKAPFMQSSQSSDKPEHVDGSSRSRHLSRSFRSLTPNSPSGRLGLLGRFSGESSRYSSPLRSASPSAKQLLLVDDNVVNLKMLAAFMMKLDWPYKTAKNGSMALSMFSMSPPGTFRYVFMDISMPVMDGFEASRQIRAVERERSDAAARMDGEHFKPTIIIALTGLASADAQQEAFASGINLFLTKPVRLKELAQILSQRQVEQAAADMIYKTNELE